MNSKKYDIAAYIWPSYHNDPRSRIFWPDNIGEWQTVMSNMPKFEGHTQPRYPLWGYVNEADPYVMAMQIDAAADHGVNIFIYDWYWYDGMPFLEGCLNDGFLKAKNNTRMKFYLMWANHDVDQTWDKRLAGKVSSTIWKGGVDFDEFKILAKRVIEKYFCQETYYKIDGKPSFMIYEMLTFIQGMGGIDKAKAALDWFRNETVKAGYLGLDLQLTMRRHSDHVYANLGTQQQLIETLGFDGMTHYQYCHFTNIDKEYSDIMPDVQGEWERLSAAYKIPYYAHVSIGWDNNPRFEMFRPGVVKNNTPDEIEKALILARDYVDARPDHAPLITINSWNEWTETSYLEPCTMFGYGYLEAVKKVFV
ncbi:MAG: glycoside hydrolase family 99-like domain-containing protein [Oscillospiraceae bacterium]|nr:glycoside hydrolase family 99-like domain-containing protein [Oscillospiraceae bacterium]